LGPPYLYRSSLLFLNFPESRPFVTLLFFHAPLPRPFLPPTTFLVLCYCALCPFSRHPPDRAIPFFRVSPTSPARDSPLSSGKKISQCFSLSLLPSPATTLSRKGSGPPTFCFLLVTSVPPRSALLTSQSGRPPFHFPLVDQVSLLLKNFLLHFPVLYAIFPRQRLRYLYCRRRVWG